MLTLKPDYVDLLKAFEWHLIVAGRSKATVRAYVGTIERFNVVAHDGAPDPLRRYLAARSKRLAAASLNLEISALRRWFRFLVTMAPDHWQPNGFPRMRRTPQRLVRALSDGEVGALLAAPDLGTFAGLRDHVIMATLYQCGLRASELVALELGDVMLDGTLLVRGKGGVQRYVPYGGAWRGLLDTYLQRRVGARPGRRNAVFVTVHGKPLRDARSVWVIVNRYARAALGLSCGFSRLEAHGRGTPWQGHYPHLLRASFATEMLKRGLDVLSIAQLLGHKDVATTAHYLGMDLSMLRAATNCHPRAKRRGHAAALIGSGALNCART